MERRREPSYDDDDDDARSCEGRQNLGQDAGASLLQQVAQFFPYLINLAGLEIGGVILKSTSLFHSRYPRVFGGVKGS
jgi:hypothetical protein